MPNGHGGSLSQLNKRRERPLRLVHRFDLECCKVKGMACSSVKGCERLFNDVIQRKGVLGTSMVRSSSTLKVE